MKRLIALDLDNTLAPLGKGIPQPAIALLRQLEQQGHTIAICSGKPTYYLCGMMRQVELNRPILLGENGAVIQFGVSLPPERFCILTYPEEAKQALSFLRSRLETLLPHVWFQPNLVGITPFPTNAAEFDTVERCLNDHPKLLSHLTAYRHCDSIDIASTVINKGAGLAYLGKLLDIDAQHTVAVGDTTNDYPMFDYAGLSLGINVKEAERVDINFETIVEGLHFLVENL